MTGIRTWRGAALGAALATASIAALAPGVAQARAQDPARPAVASAPALFEVGATASAAGKAATATRRISVDTSLLRAGVARTVSLDLFDQAPIVSLEPTDSGVEGWAAWDGTVAGDPDASATVVRKGDDVAAMIATTDGSYRIRSVGAGQQVVQRIGTDFPESTTDTLRPSESDLATTATPDAPVAADPTAAADVPTYPVIDVLVAYTPDALTEAGTTNAMTSEIALAVATANTAYSDSGVSGRLRLAGTTALSENFDLSNTSLNQITSTTDGHSDQIHTLRNSTGADLVSVLVSDPSACGLGWLLENLSTTDGEREYGFSTVNYSCAVDNFSFPHELGHNMGLNHDRYVESGSGGLFPYAFGYVNTTAKWRTIMAYNNQCSDLGFNCTRLGRFSNPDQTYLGLPLGRPSTGSTPADNHKVLNATQGHVSTYRAKTAPFTSWSRFVAQQYKDFLGRTPTSSESSTAVNALNTGDVTPDAYIDGLINGTFGSYYAPVSRLYFAYFLRTPDAGGLDYWVRKFQGGTRLTAISSNFAASSEFKNKYGSLSNRAFVEKIYTNLFSRTGDTSGVNYWTGKLDAGTKTRGEVMVNFSESSEFKRVRAEEIDVVLVYRALLQRGATASEFSSQVARLQGGVTRKRLILEVVDSTEYSGRVTK